MEGWTEAEIRNRDLMAPCGLYCGACGIYLAKRDGNDKFKAVLANLYGTKPEETECERYHCPACGKPVFRGAKRCRNCKQPTADLLDGSL